MRTRLACILVLLIFASQAAAQKPVSGSESDAVSSKPLSIGLAVDNSGSYRTIFERIVTSANTIIDDVRPGDEGFLVTFVDTPKIVLRQEMTENKQEIRDSAENMFIEGGPTAILDAVMFSAKYLAGQSKSGPDRSRILILITDGDERESAASIDDVIKTLKAANIRVFVLGIYDDKFYTKVIDRLCRETGGAKFVAKTSKETTAAVSSLLSSIRTK